MGKKDVRWLVLTAVSLRSSFNRPIISIAAAVHNELYIKNDIKLKIGKSREFKEAYFIQVARLDGRVSFGLYSLGIHTKIARGTIEIVSDIKIVTARSRVGASEAPLLNLLKLSPFTLVSIFDNGNSFAPTVLDVEEQILIDHVLSRIKAIAAISLAANYPTIASVPHSLVNSYNNIIAIARLKPLLPSLSQRTTPRLLQFLTAWSTATTILLSLPLPQIIFLKVHKHERTTLTTDFSHQPNSNHNNNKNKAALSGLGQSMALLKASPLYVGAHA
ncbi:hypothetical protein O181_060776 [Austropuccinia psidii MF-1]|uniref:Large ribosomal subunit protein uL10-like insertion domain-containing protein n=1 Tax=Austropuccinia psidii MF-1 TaxID=1389203 RepID=A0A9Q3ELI6_9BASI|nr:hypothetical protein [Austropuccinia psidii MF-1]